MLRDDTLNFFLASSILVPACRQSSSCHGSHHFHYPTSPPSRSGSQCSVSLQLCLWLTSLQHSQRKNQLAEQQAHQSQSLAMAQRGRA